MTRVVRILATLLISSLAQSSIEAGVPKGQAITYADFNFVSAIASSQSRVYFATTNGVIVFNKIESRWNEPLTGVSGLADAGVEEVRVGRFDDPICVKTARGIYQFDSLFSQWFLLPDWPVIQSDDHHLDPPKVLIMPTGINYTGDGSFLDTYGRSFRMSDVVDDGAGNRWIGTWGYGAFRGGSGSNRVERIPYGLLQDPAYALHQDDTILWISGPVLNSVRTGLSGFNLKNNRFVNLETGPMSELPDGDVNCLESDQANLYVGTSRGLFVVEKKSLRVVAHLDQSSGLSSQDIISLKRVEDELFIGTGSGLVSVRQCCDSIAYIGQKLFFNRVIYAMDVVDSYLWIASSVGAYRMALATGKLQQFQDPSRVLFNRVLDVDHFGSFLWLASDAGVVRVDTETGKVEPFRILSQKLDSRALAVNGEAVALASDGGLTMLFFDRKEPSTREFGVNDGLASDYVYALLFDGDYLWVGTDRGVTRFWWNNPHRVN